jgi:homoserine kinase
MIKFKVPATSANIGPGFDCFGLAYSFYNEYKIEKSKNMLIEGCDPAHTTKDNIFNVAFNATMKKLKKKGSYHVYYKPNIPSSRGLGSSASVIVAGCKTANLLYGGIRKLSDDEIFQIASKIEGHPDNVAPAIFGGLTASTKLLDKTFYHKKFKVSNKLHFTVLIPDFKTSTEMARKLLPKTYKKEEAVAMLSHSVLMIEALQSGDFNLLKTVCKDYIHEPYRKKLIKDYNYIKKTVEEKGNAVLLISGSGPTLLVISKKRNFGKRLKLKNTKANWLIKPMKIAK